MNEFNVWMIEPICAKHMYSFKRIFNDRFGKKVDIWWDFERLMDEIASIKASKSLNLF